MNLPKCGFDEHIKPHHSTGITSRYMAAYFNSLFLRLTFIYLHTAFATADNSLFLKGPLILCMGSTPQTVLFLHRAEAKRIQMALDLEVFELQIAHARITDMYFFVQTASLDLGQKAGHYGAMTFP